MFIGHYLALLNETNKKKRRAGIMSVLFWILVGFVMGVLIRAVK